MYDRLIVSDVMYWFKENCLLVENLYCTLLKTSIEVLFWYLYWQIDIVITKNEKAVENVCRVNNVFTTCQSFFAKIELIKLLDISPDIFTWSLCTLYFLFLSIPSDKSCLLKLTILSSDVLMSYINPNCNIFLRHTERRRAALRITSHYKIRLSLCKTL